MSFANRFSELIASGCPCIYTITQEPREMLAELTDVCKDPRRNWALAQWDVDGGLQWLHTEVRATIPATDGPLNAIKALSTLRQSVPQSAHERVILVLRNFHRFLGMAGPPGAHIAGALDTVLTAGQQSGAHLVILAPQYVVPEEIAPKTVQVDYDLPSPDALRRVLVSIVGEEALPDKKEMEHLIQAATGLTRLEAATAFSCSLARSGKLEPEPIWEIKARTLKDSNLYLHHGGETFADLGGLDAAKRFCLATVRGSATNPKAKAKGVMLLGVPGTGKSAFAKALGNEVRRPTIILDIGAMMGGIVGQTEANIRRALKTIDAMAPAVVMIDELEKALAGGSGGHVGDSGAARRLFGTFLSWLNDHTSDVYVLATCNDMSSLPSEFSRAERWDAIFFIDLPGNSQKEQIWKIYRAQYGVPQDTSPLLYDDKWTGAEIKACCRLASLMNVSLAEAAQYIVPVAVTSQETIANLRQWAAGRATSATLGGRYNPNEEMKEQMPSNKRPKIGRAVAG